jgi:hypothetical protein
MWHVKVECSFQLVGNVELELSKMAVEEPQLAAN